MLLIHPLLQTSRSDGLQQDSYLGLTVSTNLKDLFKLNFLPVLKKIQSDINRWMDLPISWIGRVNLIKMNVLPRLLHPMQMLPLWITRQIVKSIQKDLSKFIWHGKRPRLKMKTLELPIDRGGLGLPIILFYNWACHARITSDWIHNYIKGVQDHMDEWCFHLQISLVY